MFERESAEMEVVLGRGYRRERLNPRLLSGNPPGCAAGARAHAPVMRYFTAALNFRVAERKERGCRDEPVKPLNGAVQGHSRHPTPR